MTPNPGKPRDVWVDEFGGASGTFDDSGAFVADPVEHRAHSPIARLLSGTGISTIQPPLNPLSICGLRINTPRFDIRDIIVGRHKSRRLFAG